MLSPKEHKNLEKYINDIDVTRIARAFDALGEPNRCKIFRALLKQSDASVGQLAEAVGLSSPLTSQHLKILLQADLVDRTRSGKTIYYKVRSDDPMVQSLEKAVEL